MFQTDPKALGKGGWMDAEGRGPVRALCSRQTHGVSILTL
jgi:hypothetical protein